MDYKNIIELIRKKDRSGYEELYNSYGRKFYNYAVSNWKLSEDDAWDIVYQTLETLIIKLTDYTFESKKHFDNFLYKVFINFLRQQYRKSKAKNENITFINFNESISQDGIDNIDFKFDFDDKKIFRDYYQAENMNNPLLLAIKEALDKIDPIERDLLIMRAQNFSYKEISKMLKIEGNDDLKVRYLRAKIKILKLINNKK